MAVIIHKYTQQDRPRWDEFVLASKNATFIHLRQYMDYHSDRFVDHSLMAFNERGRLLAILPANINGATLYSHQGLTFGGWLMPMKQFTAATMLEIFDSLVIYLKELNINKLIYKTIPHIYHRYPAEEDIYALFRHNAEICECNISSTAIPTNNHFKYSSGQSSLIKRNCQKLEIIETKDFAPFWTLLTKHLKERYEASPVHTIEEITKLSQHFPENIRLFEVSCEGRLVAGSVIYETEQVAHSQYAAANDEGFALNAMAALHDRLLHHEYAKKAYYDFGTSNEQHGAILNESLMISKNKLGGRGIAYITYKINIK